MAKTSRFEFRLLESDRIAWETEARKSGLSLAEWIIKQCNSDTVRTVSTKPDKVVRTKEKPFICLLKQK